MFDDIEELLELSRTTNNTFGDLQIVNIGIKLLRNINDFERANETWIALPVGDQTWVNFKPHFETATIILYKIRGGDMKNTIFIYSSNLVTH